MAGGAKCILPPQPLRKPPPGSRGSGVGCTGLEWLCGKRDYSASAPSLRFCCCRFCSELSKYCSEQSFDVYVNNDETSILQGGIKMADKEVLVVASKVKAYINKQMMTSSDAITALSDKVCVILDEAVERAKANRRSTVMAQDP